MSIQHIRGRAKIAILELAGWQCLSCGTAYELIAVDGLALCATCERATRPQNVIEDDNPEEGVAA